jgi:hypothetical protein
MIAIVTKHHGATNYKPSRISARISYPISPEDERTRVFLSYGIDKDGNVVNSDEMCSNALIHRPAAELLADRAGLELLPGMFGELPGSGAYGAYVFLAKRKIS